MSGQPRRFAAALAEYCREHMSRGDWRACLEAVQGCVLTGRDFRVLPYHSLIPFLVKSGQWQVLGQAQMALMPPPYRPAHTKEVSPALPSRDSSAPTKPSVGREGGAERLISLIESDRLGDAADGVETASSSSPVTTSAEQADGTAGEELLSFRMDRQKRRVKIGSGQGHRPGDVPSSRAPGAGEERDADTNFSAQDACALLSLLLIAAAEAGPQGDDLLSAEEAIRMRSVVELVTLATAHQLPLSADAVDKTLVTLKNWLVQEGLSASQRDALMAVTDVLKAEKAHHGRQQAAFQTVARENAHKDVTGESTGVSDASSPALASEEHAKGRGNAAVESLVPITQQLANVVSQHWGPNGLRTSDRYTRLVARLDRALRTMVVNEEETNIRAVTASLVAAASDEAATLVSELALRLLISHLLAETDGCHASLVVEVTDAYSVAATRVEAGSREKEHPSGQRSRHSKESGEAFLPVPGLTSKGTTDADAQSLPTVAVGASSILILMAASEAVRRAYPPVSQPPGGLRATTISLHSRSTMVHLISCVRAILSARPTNPINGLPVHAGDRAPVEAAATAAARLLDQEPALIHALLQAREECPPAASLPYTAFLFEVLEDCQWPDRVARHLGSASVQPAKGQAEEASATPPAAARGGRRRTVTPVRSTSSNAKASEHKDADGSLSQGIAALFAAVFPILAQRCRSMRLAVFQQARAQSLSRACVWGAALDTDAALLSQGADGSEANVDDDFDLALFSEQLLGEVSQEVARQSRRRRQEEDATHDQHGGMSNTAGRTDGHGDEMNSTRCANFVRRALCHGGPRATDMEAVALFTVTALSAMRMDAVALLLDSVPEGVRTSVTEKMLSTLSSGTFTGRVEDAAAYVSTCCELLAHLLRTPHVALDKKAEWVTQFFSSDLVSSHATGGIAPAKVAADLYAANLATFQELHEQAMLLEGAMSGGGGDHAAAETEAPVRQRNLRSFAASLSPLDRLMDVLARSDKESELGIRGTVARGWSVALPLLQATAVRGTGDPTSPNASATAWFSPVLAPATGPSGSASSATDSLHRLALSSEESKALTGSLRALARTRRSSTGAGTRAVHDAIALFYQQERTNRRLTMAEVERFAWVVRRGPWVFAQHLLTYCGEHRSKTLAWAAVACALRSYHRSVAAVGNDASQRALLRYHCEQHLIAALRLLPHESEEAGTADAFTGDGRESTMEDKRSAQPNGVPSRGVTAEEVRQLCARIRPLYERRTRSRREDRRNGHRAVDPVYYTCILATGLLELPVVRRARAELERALALCQLTHDATSAKEAYVNFVAHVGPAAARALPRDMVLRLLHLEVSRLSEVTSTAGRADTKADRPQHTAAAPAAAESEAPYTDGTEFNSGGTTERLGYVLELLEIGFTASAIGNPFSFVVSALPLVFSFTMASPGGTPGESLVPWFYPTDASAVHFTATEECALLDCCLAHLTRGEKMWSGALGTHPNAVRLPDCVMGFLLGIVRARCAFTPGPHGHLLRRLARSFKKSSDGFTQDEAILQYWLLVLQRCQAAVEPPLPRSSASSPAEEVTATDSPSCYRELVYVIPGAATLARDDGDDQSSPRGAAHLSEDLVRELCHTELSEWVPSSEVLSAVSFTTSFLEKGCTPPRRPSALVLYTTALENAAHRWHSTLHAARYALPKSFLPPTAARLSQVEPGEEHTRHALDGLRGFSVISSFFYRALLLRRRLAVQRMMCGYQADGVDLYPSRFLLRSTTVDCAYRVNKVFLLTLDAVVERWEEEWESSFLSQKERASAAGEHPLAVFVQDLLFFAYTGFTSFAVGAAAPNRGNRSPSEIRMTGTLHRLSHQVQRAVHGMQRSAVAEERGTGAWGAEKIAVDLLVHFVDKKASSAETEGRRSDAGSCEGFLRASGTSDVAAASGNARLLHAMVLFCFVAFPDAGVDGAMELCRHLTHSEMARESNTLSTFAEDEDDVFLSQWRAHLDEQHESSLVSPSVKATLPEDSIAEFAAQSPSLRLAVLLLAFLHAPDAFHQHLLHTYRSVEDVVSQVCVPFVTLSSSSSSSAGVADDLLTLSSSSPRVRGVSSLMEWGADAAVGVFCTYLSQVGRTTTSTSAERVSAGFTELMEELSLAAPTRADLAAVLVLNAPLSPTHNVHQVGDSVVVSTLAQRADVAMRCFPVLKRAGSYGLLRLASVVKEEMASPTSLPANVSLATRVALRLSPRGSAPSRLVYRRLFEPARIFAASKATVMAHVNPLSLQAEEQPCVLSYPHSRFALALAWQRLPFNKRDTANASRFLTTHQMHYLSALQDTAMGPASGEHSSIATTTTTSDMNDVPRERVAVDDSHVATLSASQYVLGLRQGAVSTDGVSFTKAKAEDLPLLVELASAPTAVAMCDALKRAAPLLSTEGSVDDLAVTWRVTLLRLQELEVFMLDSRHMGQASVDLERRNVLAAFMCYVMSATEGTSSAPPVAPLRTLFAEVAAFLICTDTSTDGPETSSIEPVSLLQQALGELPPTDTWLPNDTMDFLKCVAAAATPSAQRSMATESREQLWTRFCHSPWPPAALQHAEVSNAFSAPTTPSLLGASYVSWNPAALAAALRPKTKSDAADMRLALRILSHVTKTPCVGYNLVVDRVLRVLYHTNSSHTSTDYYASLRLFVDRVLLKQGQSLGYVPAADSWHMVLSLVVERNGLHRKDTAVSEHVEAVGALVRRIAMTEEAMRATVRVPPQKSQDRTVSFLRPRLFTKRDMQSLLVFALRAVRHAQSFGNPLGWHDARQATLNRCWTALLEMLVTFSRFAQDGERGKSPFPRTEDGAEVNLWCPNVHQALRELLVHPTISRGEPGVGLSAGKKNQRKTLTRRKDIGESFLDAKLGRCADPSSEGPPSAHHITARQLLRFFSGVWVSASKEGSRHPGSVTASQTGHTTDASLLRIIAHIGNSSQEADSQRPSERYLSNVGEQLAQGGLPTSRGWLRALRRAVLLAAEASSSTIATTVAEFGLDVFFLYAPYQEVDGAILDHAALLMLSCVKQSLAEAKGSRREDVLAKYCVRYLVEDGMRVPLGPRGVAAVAELYTIASQGQQEQVKQAPRAVHPLPSLADQLLWRTVNALAGMDAAQRALALATWTDGARRESVGMAVARGCVMFLTEHPHHQFAWDAPFLSVGEELWQACRQKSKGPADEATVQHIGSGSFLDAVIRAYVRTSHRGTAVSHRIPRSRAMQLYTLWKEANPLSGDQRTVSWALEIEFLDAVHRLYDVAAEHRAVLAVGNAPAHPLATPVGPSTLWREALNVLATARRDALSFPTSALPSMNATGELATTSVISAMRRLSARSLDDLCAAWPVNQWRVSLDLMASLDRSDAATVPLRFRALMYLTKRCDVASIPLDALLAVLHDVTVAEAAEAAQRTVALTPPQRANRRAALRAFALRVAAHPNLTAKEAERFAVEVANISSHTPLGTQTDDGEEDGAGAFAEAFHAAVITSLYKRGLYTDVLRFAVATGCADLTRTPAQEVDRLVKEVTYLVAAPTAVSQVLDLLKDARRGVAEAQSRKTRLEELLLPQPRGTGDHTLIMRKPNSRILRDVEECLRNNHAVEAARMVVCEHPFLLSQGLSSASPHTGEGMASGGKTLFSILRGLARHSRWSLLSRFTLACYALSCSEVGTDRARRWRQSHPQTLKLMLRALTHTASSDVSASLPEAIACAAELSAALLSSWADSEDAEETATVLAEAWTWMYRTSAPTAAAHILPRSLGRDSPSAVFVASRIACSSAEVVEVMAHNQERLAPLLISLATSQTVPDGLQPGTTRAICRGAVQLLSQVPFGSSNALGVTRAFAKQAEGVALKSEDASDVDFLTRLLEEIETSIAEVEERGRDDLRRALSRSLSSLTATRARDPRAETTVTPGLSSDAQSVVLQWRDERLQRSRSDATGAVRDTATILCAAPALPHALFGLSLPHLRRVLNALANTTVPPPVFFTVCRAVCAVLADVHREDVLPFPSGGIAACVVEALHLRQTSSDASAELGSHRSSGDGAAAVRQFASAWSIATETSSLVAHLLSLMRGGTLSSKVVLDAVSMISIHTSPLSLEKLEPLWDSICTHAAAAPVTSDQLLNAVAVGASRGAQIHRQLRSFSEADLADVADPTGVVLAARRQAHAQAEQTWRFALALLDKHAAQTTPPSASAHEDRFNHGKAGTALAASLVQCATAAGASSSPAETLRSVEAILSRLPSHVGVLHLSSETRALVKVACIDACGASWRPVYVRLISYQPAPAAGTQASVDASEAEEARVLRALALVKDYTRAVAIVEEAATATGPRRCFSLCVHATVLKILTARTNVSTDTPEEGDVAWAMVEDWFFRLLNDAHVPTETMLDDCVAFLCPLTTSSITSHIVKDANKQAAPLAAASTCINGLRFMRLLTLLPPVRSARHRKEKHTAAPVPQGDAKAYTMSSHAVNTLLTAADEAYARNHLPALEVRHLVGTFVRWYADWSRPPKLTSQALDSCVRILCVPLKGDAAATAVPLSALLDEALVSGQQLVDQRDSLHQCLPDGGDVTALLRVMAKQHTLHQGESLCSASSLCQLFAAAAATSPEVSAFLLTLAPPSGSALIEESALPPMMLLMRRVAQDAAMVSPVLRAALALAVSEQTVWNLGGAPTAAAVPSTQGTAEAPPSFFSVPHPPIAHDASTDIAAVQGRSLAVRIAEHTERVYEATLWAFTPPDAIALAQGVLGQLSAFPGASRVASKDAHACQAASDSLSLLQDIMMERETAPSLDLSLPYRALMLATTSDLRQAEPAVEAETLSVLLAWLQGGAMSFFRSSPPEASLAQTHASETASDSAGMPVPEGDTPSLEQIAAHAVADIFLLTRVVQGVIKGKGVSSPSEVASPRQRRSLEQLKRLLHAMSGQDINPVFSGSKAVRMALLATLSTRKP